MLSCKKEKLSASLRRITSKDFGGFYYLNCLHPFQTENKLRSENCKKHDHCDIKMCIEIGKILKYIQGLKSIRSPFAFYPDTKSLLEKIHACKNNPKNMSTIKVDKHTTCFTQCEFDETKITLITSEVNTVCKDFVKFQKSTYQI